MDDAAVAMPASMEAGAKTKRFCTGRCTTTCLFLSFVYAASVYCCSLFSIKAPPALLPIASALPNVVALIILRHVFGQRASYMQGFYVSLSTLSLALPILFCLPLLRHGWVLVVGLLDLAANAANVFSLVKPGFLLWSLLDAFVLRASVQEAIKFGICFQLREKQKVYRLQNLIFYGAAAAITFSLVMTTNDSIRLAYQSVPSPEGPRETQRLGALWGFAVFHGAFELPSQIITAVLIACNLAVTDKEEGNSFIQVLRCPILLHGIPAFCTQLARHLSQNVAMKLLWGRQVEAIPQQALRAVAATTALCHFVSTVVMIGSLVVGLIACRRAFLRAMSRQDYQTSTAESTPRFLFSLKDLFQNDIEDRSATAALLGKEADNQA